MHEKRLGSMILLTFFIIILYLSCSNIFLVLFLNVIEGLFYFSWLLWDWKLPNIASKKKEFGGLAMSKQSKLTICGIRGEWISNKKKSNRAIGFGSIYQVSLDCNGTKMDEKENWLASKLSSKSFVFKDFCFDLT